MRKPTARQLDSIARLLGDSDFQVVLGWFDESFSEEAITSLRIDKEPHRSWSQGRAQLLERMIKIVKEAPEMLAAANKQGGQ